MAILYGKEPAYDVRDLGFDRSLVKGAFSGSADDVPPDMQSVFQQGLSAALLGSGSLGKNISLGHQVISAQPTDNLQEIIETLADGGGGTLKLGAYTYVLDYDIELRSNVSVVGEGLDTSILDFNGTTYSFMVVGTSSAIVTNIFMTGFTIQDSHNATAGLFIHYADHWSVRNIRVTDCFFGGIKVQTSEYFSMTDVRSDNNGGRGFDFVGDSALDETQFITLVNCVADNNNSDGFRFALAGGGSPVSVFGCTAEDNTLDGFAVSSSTSRYIRFFGCNSESNGVAGFDIDADNTGLFGCYALFNVTDIDCSLYGCIVVGCVTDGSVSFPDSSIYTQGNFNLDINDVRNYLQVKNTSGGTLDAGHVVIFKSVASGREVTTTTTAGDDKVLGMVLGANSSSSIANNGEGQILTQGFTALLKVDGTTDIAVGDFLTCFTTAGIAAKAAAGDMVFAIALEAYTTNDSNGVIDAVLISPRLI